MKNLIAGLSIYAWFLTIAVLSLLFLSSCSTASGNRTKTVAARSLQTDKIIDITVHTHYQKGDTVVEIPRLDPTVKLKFVLLE
jgi:hypothetical protein